MMTIVHHKSKNGVTYVYESEGYWDKEKQQARSHRKCIGKLDPETGEFIPSKKYMTEKELETLKQRPPGPVPVVESRRLFHGATYLFDAIGEKLGVNHDLRRCFPDTYDKILSVAYYLIMEDQNPLSRFPKWGRTHVHPYGRELPSQRSSDLFSSIGEHGKQQFFRAQSSRRLETEYLAYDTTSISSYSKLMKQVKWGKNKEHDPLPQINLALVYGQKSRLPAYYRKLPGNITDVMTVQKILNDIDFLELDKVQLVMDRGFYSEANVNVLFRQHYKFLMAARTGLSFVQRHLDPVRDSMLSRSCYSSKLGLNYHSQTITWSYRETKKRSGEVVTSEKRMYLHMFYNEQRAVDDKMAFNRLLDDLEEELRTDQRNPAHEALYARYYDVNRTPKRGITLVPKQEAIDAARKNYGYFVLISNGIKDPLEAIKTYRAKDVIEKAFGNLKERLNMRRTSVSSEENLDGKLFVQFVALIHLAYIDKIMRDNELYKDYTLQGLLDELDIIERFEQPGKKHHIGEMTKKQLKIYQLFGIDPPS